MFVSTQNNPTLTLIVNTGVGKRLDHRLKTDVIGFDENRF